MNLKLGLVTVLHPSPFTQQLCVLRSADVEPRTAKNMPEEPALTEQMPFTSTSEWLHDHCALVPTFAGVTEPGC